MFKPDLTLEEVQAENPEVSRGRHHPEECQAVQRVAILIPHRNRERHLLYLLEHLHPFLQRQQLDYGIYIIHQVSVGFPGPCGLRRKGSSMRVVGERIIIRRRIFSPHSPLKRAEEILILNSEPWGEALGGVTVLTCTLGGSLFLRAPLQAPPPTMLATASPYTLLSSPASPISYRFALCHTVWVWASACC